MVSRYLVCLFFKEAARNNGENVDLEVGPVCSSFVIYETLILRDWR